MAAVLKHTIGAADGARGVPLLNWSRQHGDLRIAHFLGMHTLQVFPLVGFYITRSSRAMIVFACAYAGLVIFVLVQACLGLPLL